MENVLYMRRRFDISIFFLFLMWGFSEASINEYGILTAKTPLEKENFCIVYFKDFISLPIKSEAKFHILEDASEIDWCEEQPQVNTTDKVVLAIRNNCSISTQAHNVHDSGAVALFFIVTGGRVDSPYINATVAASINVTVGLISNTSVQSLKAMEPEVMVSVFVPDMPNFDYNLLIIWILAMFTIIVGSYWSGHIRYANYCREVSVLPGGDPKLPNKPCVKASTVEGNTLSGNACYIAIFVGCMGGMLMLMYFFFDYLVYVIIGIFVVACIQAVYCCLNPLVLKIPGAFWKVSELCGHRMHFHVDIRQIILLVFSITISVFWVVVRKHNYAWILQDALGITFCIHMLKSICLPNLKICTVLLVLLFFYDIFFVFVTPFFTMKGESIMEKVATGGKSDEMLPMVLTVSPIGSESLSVCPRQFSILGFGDILVPGLLLSYLKGFDLMTHEGSLYFHVTVIAYGIGMLITFGGLFLMSMAQPALLYLVPATLIPPFVIGWFRGEISLLWNGVKLPTEGCPHHVEPPAPEVVASINPVTGEHKHLLR